VELGRYTKSPMDPDELPDDVRKSLDRALLAGVGVHAPVVRTRVQAALDALDLPLSQEVRDAFEGRTVYLMLDIDGVLHEQGASRIDDQGKLVGQGLFKWWPRLRQVLYEHQDVRVVLHSSWARLFGPLQYLEPLLPPDLFARVVDTTDVNEHRRGHAVQAWLDAHPLDVGAYVVLDDRDEGFGSHVPLVLCDPKRGLSDSAKVEELRAALVAAKERARR
jgi:hypothetical protein